MSQALYFLQDLKMGHYMKVPVSWLSGSLWRKLLIAHIVAESYIYGSNDSCLVVVHSPNCRIQLGTGKHSGNWIIASLAVSCWRLPLSQNICTNDQADQFTCPGAKVFYTASIIWGAIGPWVELSTSSADQMCWRVSGAVSSVPGRFIAWCSGIGCLVHSSLFALTL